MAGSPALRQLLGWVLDVLLGGLVGLVAGALVAVNFVIGFGPPSGHEATLAEVFAHNVVVGVVTVLILLAGPMVGVVLARRLRRWDTARAQHCDGPGPSQ